jgi:flagellar biosynthesis protein FlhG
MSNKNIALIPQTSKPIQVIAISSGKGGVGKTTVAMNLGAALSSQGQSVLLLDADLGLANIDVLLDLNPTFNISHVLSGEKNLEDVLINGPAGLSIIPSASGIQKMSELSTQEHAGLIHAFNDIDQHVDTLIIDTAAGINNSVMSFCQAASEVFVVLCDEPASLTDGYSLIKVLNQERGIHRFHVLANMVDSDESGFEIFQRLLLASDRFLNVAINYLGAIHQDNYVRRAGQLQKLAIEAFPQSKAVRSYQRLANEICAWKTPECFRESTPLFFDQLTPQTSPA